MGEVLAAGFSDRGSIPLISIKKPLRNQRLLFFVFDCMPYCLKYYWIKIEEPGKNPRFLFMSKFIYILTGNYPVLFVKIQIRI